MNSFENTIVKTRATVVGARNRLKNSAEYATEYDENSRSNGLGVRSYKKLVIAMTEY